MFFLTLVAPLVVLARAVVADPIVVRDSLISLPIARQMNAVHSGRDLVQRDRVRARGFGKDKCARAREKETATSIGATDTGNFYTASIGVGIPPTYYNLVIDTGSANTWVGANKKYVVTKTSAKTSNSVSQTYGTGSFSGHEYTDTVTISPGFVISKQSIGVSSKTTGVTDADGMLGLGPADLAAGSLSPDVNAGIPTVTDNLFKSGAIKSNVFSVSFEPTTKTHEKNGELTFGGTDPTKYTGRITYAPLSTTNPANLFWSVDLSIKYGTSDKILQQTPCVIDTGTSVILLETDAFNRYRKATGAVFDKKAQLLRITPAQFANLKSLFFTIGGRDFEFTANAQIWPRALNSLVNGESGSIYLIFGELGSELSSSGISCISGYSFLERYYTVFDATHQRIGFATTPFTRAHSN